MTKKYGEISFRSTACDEASELMFNLMKEHAGKYSTAEWSVAFTSTLILRRDIANLLVEEENLSSEQKKIIDDNNQKG